MWAWNMEDDKIYVDPFYVSALLTDDLPLVRERKQRVTIVHE